MKSHTIMVVIMKIAVLWNLCHTVCKKCTTISEDLSVSIIKAGIDISYIWDSMVQVWL
jgi:hypothetical protein